MNGWQRYGAHSYWRRVLSDGSYLSVLPDDPAPADDKRFLRWVWRHRGPGYDRRQLGTCINAQGHASDPAGARDAADRYAAGLTHLSTQEALFGGASI